jgi:hypothetical protein
MSHKELDLPNQELHEREGASASWRNDLLIHPAAEMFPLMIPGELRTFAEDIKANGLMSPIVLWTDGKSPAQLLDGRNRLDAIEMVIGPVIIGAPSITAGKDFLACNKVIVLDKSVDPVAYVISANIHRRHLSAEQKRDLIAKLIKAQPEKSDRQIADTVKVDHKTVGAVRAEQEARGEIPHVETRTDSKGRQQPAKRKPAIEQPVRNYKALCNELEAKKAKWDIADIGSDSAGKPAPNTHIKELEVQLTHFKAQSIELRSENLELTAALANKLARVSNEKLLAELERRLSPQFLKTHQVTMKAIARALETTERHVGPTLDLKASPTTDNEGTRH